MDAAMLATAWTAGIEATEALLAEDVVIEWWTDCAPPTRGRGEVLEMFRGSGLPALHFEDVDDGLVLATSAPGHLVMALVIHQDAGRVTQIVQYDSREQAIRHVSGIKEYADVTDGFLPADHPLAEAVVTAIRAGDVDVLGDLLASRPELATVRIGGAHGSARTLLHIVTDWPGHFPAGARTVSLLVRAGADVNARFTGAHRETPLHWAASTDDVSVLDALLDAGADIHADGAVIAGGTALADATAFGQWNAARRLVERGATTTLGEAASLGLVDRVRTHLAEDGPSPEDVTSALWMACHGGQRATAEILLDHGADLNWVGYDDLTPLDAAVRSEATELAAWLRQRGAS